MKFSLSLALVVASALPVVADEQTTVPPDDDSYVRLFNGENLDGWKKAGGEATYTVDGETIVGEVGPGPNTFLMTERTYGDFIFKVELKLEVPGNSGIQFRSHQRENGGRVYGYQMEIDPSDRKWSGGIYDEGRDGWLYPLKDMPEKQAAFKLNDWNEYVIKAEGDHLQTWVNGVHVADLHDTKDAEGFIALQVHSGKAGKILWKNIRIKELSK